MAKKSKKEEEFKLSIPKKKLFQVVAVVLAAAVLVVAAGAVTGYFSFGNRTPRGVEAKALNFINTNFMYPGMEAELVDSTFEDGVHVITLSIQGQIFETFVTEDEKYMFLESIDMNDPEMIQMILGPEAEINTEIIGRQVETQQEAEEKTLNFINEYLLEPGMEAELIETNIESGLYRMDISIDFDIIEVFVNQEGRYIFLGPINLDEEIEMLEAPTYDGVYTEDGDLIVYYFYNDGCPYCTVQREIFDELKIVYGEEIELRSYNTADRQNLQFAQEMADMHGVRSGGVPLTFMGGEAFMGRTNYEVLEAQIVNCIETVC